MLIEARVTANGTVAAANCEALDLDSIPPEKRERLAAVASRTASSRFNRASEEGKKLGRNDLCLCGSGLKYKKCHWGK